MGEVRSKPGVSEVVHAVSEVLASCGFEVTTGFKVTGLSGYEHQFSVSAQRGDAKLLIDTPQGVFDVLASLAKRVDVRGYEFIIVVVRGIIGSILPELEASRAEVLKEASFVVFDDIEDLREKLQQFLKRRVTQMQ